MTAMYGGGLGSGLTGTLPPGMDPAHRAELERIAKSEVCAVCDGSLDVAVDPTIPERVLRCNRCSVNRPDSRPRDEPSLEQRFQRYLRGDSSAAPTLIETQMLDHILRQRINAAISNGKEPSRRDEKALGQLEAMVNKDARDQAAEDSRALTIVQGRDIITQEQAVRWIKATPGVNIWEQLEKSPALKEAFIGLMIRTGLHPGRNEICVYEGKPFIMRDGWASILNRSNTFDGMPVPPKYLSVAEKEAQGIAVGKIVVQIALQRKGQRFPVYGLGIADAKAPHRGNQPVEVQHPQVMAEARAYRRGARLGWQDLLNDLGLMFEGADKGDADPTVRVRTVGAEPPAAIAHNADGMAINRETGEPVDDQGYIEGDYSDLDAPDEPSDPEADELERKLDAFVARTKKNRAKADEWFHGNLGTVWAAMDTPTKAAALHDLTEYVERRAKAAQGAV